MVPSAPDAWSSRVVATTFGPVFIQDRSASGKRDSSAQRQTAQNRLQARNGLRGDRNAAARARQLRAFWPSPGNLAVRKSAWWGWQDSNLRPDRYERTSPGREDAFSGNHSLSTGLPAQEERACETDGTVETSVPCPSARLCPGLRWWKRPIWRESTGGPP